MYLGQDTATDGAHEPPDACKKDMRVHIRAQRHKTILWSKWSFGILKGGPQSADGFVLFTLNTTSTPQFDNWACLPCCHPSPSLSTPRSQLNSPPWRCTGAHKNGKGMESTWSAFQLVSSSQNCVLRVASTEVQSEHRCSLEDSLLPASRTSDWWIQGRFLNVLHRAMLWFHQKKSHAVSRGDLS